MCSRGELWPDGDEAPDVVAEDAEVVDRHADEEDGEADGDDFLLGDEALHAAVAGFGVDGDDAAASDVLEEGDEEEHGEAGTHVEIEGEWPGG